MKTIEEEVTFLKNLRKCTLLSGQTPITKVEVFLMLVQSTDHVDSATLVPQGTYLFKSEQAIYETYNKAGLLGKYSIARVEFAELCDSIKRIKPHVWETQEEVMSLRCMTVRMI